MSGKPGESSDASPQATRPELLAFQSTDTQRSGIAVALAEAEAAGSLARDDRSLVWRKRLALLRRVLKWGAIAALVGSGLGAIGIFSWIRHIESNLPSVSRLRQGYRPPQVTRIVAGNGALLANIFVERRTVVDITALPPHVKLAFLAAEDASFYEHEGLDYLGMLRALVRNLKAGHTVQGGSTITQQVVKNLLLDSERSYSRKARETILARKLEQHLQKDDIFGLYLNHIYLGHGRYGVEEAARFYFGKHAKELDLAEAATLAGIIAAPERYSPRRAAERALGRRHFVLSQMLAKGFITRELFEQASVDPLRLAPAAEAEPDLAPEMVALAKKTLESSAGDRAQNGGFTIVTTLNSALQSAARDAVRKNLGAYAKRHKLTPPYTLEERRLWGKPFDGTPRKHGIYVGKVVALDDGAGTIDVKLGSVVGRVHLAREERYNPDRLLPSQFTALNAVLRVGLLEDPNEVEVPHLRLELGPQSALAAIDVRSRELVALVGSYEALGGGLDRASQSRRQPGSAFKPFVYGYAMASRRFTPASLFVVPATSSTPEETVRLRSALARSMNPVVLQVLSAVGPAQVVEWAQAAGIESKLGATPSLALGAYEVTPLELANAYATFASGGWAAPPVLVKSMVDSDGRPVALPPEPPRRRAMDEDVAYLVSSLLQSVVEEGTGRAARSLRRPLAGKTGTTNKAKDSWFVGYSTDIVAAVWVGYDDALPLGPGESGAATALPAWIDFMRVAHDGKPPTRFPRPASIIVQRIDPRTGLLAPPDMEDALEEEFLPGATPLTQADATLPDAGTGNAGPSPSEENPGTPAMNDGAPAAPDDNLPPQGATSAPLSDGAPTTASARDAAESGAEASPHAGPTPPGSAAEPRPEGDSAGSKPSEAPLRPRAGSPDAIRPEPPPF